ncbi:Subtilase family protein [Blastococcus sp. DSM 46786]|uniref:S8 family serine peptidase n=1 Tax=Blastococcus sp. DSM 46786 TaxID=1798227 RepID=UPI0008C59D25|nr:S8 family serine peptidase [Blastococcus sp. DSM 46786]SEK59215.1 Subtilase family protein [Blastococcus sp. DSM 46786]
MALTSIDRLGDYVLIALLRSDQGAGRPKEVISRIRETFGELLQPEDREPVRSEEGESTTSEMEEWERRTYVALRRLISAQWVRADRRRWQLTETGRSVGQEAEDRLEAPEDRPPVTRQPADRALVRPSVLANPLLDPDERARIGLPVDDDTAIPVLVELNVRYRGGVDEALHQLETIAREEAQMSADRVRAGRLTEDTVALRMSMRTMQRLVERDAAGTTAIRDRAIHRVWPDFPVQPLVDSSSRAVKADAARRAFSAYGDGIVWAVVDSGIDREHPHFTHGLTVDHDDVRDLHRDFTKSLHPGSDTAASALVDERGHGTHVAGIIAGQAPPGDSAIRVEVLRDRFADAEEHLPGPTNQRGFSRELLAGIAPRARLVSLKALPQEEDGQTSRVIAALRYVRELNAASDRLMRIHGVNLSVGYEFDPKWFACGQSPLCREVDRLVRTGVVVVVAAGNTGYGRLSAFVRQTSTGVGMTINDPGNAERAITVGATHRDRPHTYGVSYFSSKGPTGDGRAKPDLVAPGERIASCAAGAKAAAKVAGGRAPHVALYIEDSGTSMAAPHVSGAVAAFLSVRPEFIGQPERVKEIFCRSATSLGREHYFQGAGLLDLMRALQSV